MARRSPQEKKRLDYAKQRRNNYGENDKSSRTSIRRNKQSVSRANRHRAHQDLTTVRQYRDEADVEVAADRAVGRRPKRWQKFPDLALGVHVEGALKIRMQRGMNERERTAAKIKQIRRSTPSALFSAGDAFDRVELSRRGRIDES